MIILTAGHTGSGTGAQGVEVINHGKIDEGSETIWLRNRIAEILSTRWGIIVLLDRDNEKLGLLTERINQMAQPSDFCLDLHLNASSNSTANGSEIIVRSDASNYEIKMGVQLLNGTAHALNTNVRCVKTEEQTPAKRLAMLHLKCNSVILEICFCTNSNDAMRYIKNREKLAETIAEIIAKNIVVNE